MVTVRTGEILLERYNKEYNTNLTPKEFFCEIVAPLLFYGNKHLVCWINSKFSNPQLPVFKACKNGNITKEVFDNVLNEFCEGIENLKHGVLTTLNIFGGCAIPEYGCKTMFCYSDNLDFNVEERYCSFIGSIVCLQIEGWNSVIYDEETIWEVFNGVKLYREMLDNNSNLDGNQLYAWNSAYLFNKHMGNVDTIYDEYYESNGRINLKNKINFSNFLFLLVKLNRNIRIFDLFIVNKTNKTCSTILIDIDYVSTQSKLYKKIYEKINEDFRYADFNKLFGGKNLLYKAIEIGRITEGFFNPLLDINKKNKYLSIYIELIMTDEEKKLASVLAKCVKLKKKENPRLVYHEDKIFKSKDAYDLIENLMELPNFEDLAPLVELITQDNFSKEKIKQFLILSKFYFKNN